MKKILFVSLLALICFSADAALVQTGDWKFEPTLGPSIGVKSADTRFGMNFKVGRENWGYQLSMAFGGTPGVLLRPAIVYDLPYYFTFSSSRKNDFSVGPTFSVGPILGFKGATMIDFLTISFGARTTYQFSKRFGAVAELINFNMGFVRWISGVGINTNFTITYDMKFGIFMLF